MLAQTAAANTSAAHVVRPRHLSPVTPSTRPTSPAPIAAVGYFATMRAIRGSARLTSTERLVLLMIAGHTDNGTGEACPGIPKLAAECRLTTRTIERTIAALVASGWLVRDSAASRWGTNVYRVTPVAADMRPTSPRRYGRPFDRVTPDRMSGDPPSRVQPTPDTGSGILPLPLHDETALCVASPAEHEAPESTHTEVFEVDQKHEHETPAAELADVGAVELHEVDQEAPAGVEQGISAALSSHPELQALARPPVVAILAAERRPLPVVRRALAELAEHARDAAAVGDPFSVATLARKARAYVRRAYEDGESTPPSCTSTRPTSPPTPEPPCELPRLASTAGHLRGILAALGTGDMRRHM